MFPEFQGLVDELKSKDPHFKGMLDKHRDLDLQIVKMESGDGSGIYEHLEVEALKKKKLALKDELYQTLKKAQRAD
ncbi:MAG: YdcH family protein [Actinomycetota bacterium]